MAKNIDSGIVDGLTLGSKVRKPRAVYRDE